MTDKTISQLPAITALAASDLLAVDQDTGGGSYVTSRITGANLLAGALSPASLAVSGATLGSDKLAVTGSATLSGALTAAALAPSGSTQVFGFFKPASFRIGVYTGSLPFTFDDSNGLVIGRNAAPARYGLQIYCPTSSASTFLHLTNAGTGSTNVDGTVLSVASDGSTALIVQENASLALYANNTLGQTVTASGAVQMPVSLAINGASIGSDKLAVAGSASFSGTIGATSLSLASSSPLASLQRSAATNISFLKLTGGGNGDAYFGMSRHDGSGFIGASADALVVLTDGAAQKIYVAAGSTTGAIFNTDGSVQMPVSLAINGASIGGDKLAVSGTVSISGATDVGSLKIAGVAVLQTLTASNIASAGTQPSSVANNGVIEIAPDNHCFLDVVQTTNAWAEFKCGGGVAIKAQGSDNIFTTTKDTASKINVYTESGVVKLQNKTGSAISIGAFIRAYHG